MLESKAILVRAVAFLALILPPMLVVPTHARAAESAPQSFDISPQSLATALSEFARQSQRELLFTPELVAEKTTSGVQGNLEPLDALAALLKNTGINFSTTPNGAILLRNKNSIAATEVIHLAQSGSSENSNNQNDPDNKNTRGDSSSEEAPQKLEEIVVSAQKRQERLQDVPVPVAAINADTLAESNQVLLRDYYTKIPNLNLTPGTQSSQILSIRGITTGRGNPTVGVVVDDVPYGSSFGLGGGEVVPDIDPGDLARIEVLRGPQGTLYGPSSMGGLLKFVTVDPSTTEFSGRLQAGVSSVEESDDVGYNLRGSFNLPLGDSLAVRVSGFHRQDPGYIDNLQTGERDVNSAKANGGRLSLLWKPSSDTSLKLGALVQEIDGDGSSDSHVGLGEFQQRTLINTGWYERKVRAFDMTFATSLGAVDLTSVTGYNINSYSSALDFSYGYASIIGPMFGVTGAPIINNNETKKFTQELRLQVPITERVELLVGGFYTDEDSYLTQNVPAQNVTTGATVGRYLYIDVPTTYSDLAVFANLTFNLTDRFSVQVGGRQSWLRQRFEQTVVTALSATTERVAVTAPIITEPDVFTYLVTPQFRFTPELMAYARFASGYRAGGTNAGDGVPPQYEPDETKNYELGFKGDFLDGALGVDASLYYIDWESIQLAVRPQTFQYTTNASSAEAKGIELSIQSRPFTGFYVSTSLVWNESELAEDFPLSARAVAYGLEGDRLPWNSRFSGSLSVQQEVELSNDLSAYIGATGSYVGDREGVFRPATAPTREQFPSYTKVDLTLGIRMGGWRANAFVNNVGDEKGVLWGGIGAIPPFGYYYTQPRTYGMSLTHQF